jgi:acetyl esterase/lipase
MAPPKEAGETMRHLLAVLIFALLLTVDRAAAQPPAQSEAQNIAYGPDPQEHLDICIPPYAVDGAPALLTIHGGGWRRGSRHALDVLCKGLARHGIVVFNMDYRLLTTAPDTKWPAQINDAQLALRWARAHASAYGADPSHLCAEGDSAGGHMALLLDALTTIHAGDRASLLPGISPQANCVVDISGIADLVSIDAVHPGYANFLIGNSDPAILSTLKADGSAALQLRPGAGPALLLHGLLDPAVPFTQATEMQESLSHVGTSSWLISHEGGHEFDGMTAQQERAFWDVAIDFIGNMKLGLPHAARVDEMTK